jgi:hypothetical protein
MDGKGSAFRADDGERPTARLPRPQAPGQLEHLHAIAVAPYDGAALVERCADIEGGCRHVREHNKNAATMQPIPVSGELHVQRLSIEGGGGGDP